MTTQSLWKSRAPRTLFVFLSVTVVVSCSKTETPTATTDSIQTVTVSPGALSMSAVDETVQLQATATRVSGNQVSGATYAWSSVDPGVATVSASGLVTALATGTTVVSATLEGVAGSATVTVGFLASSIVVTPSTATLVATGESV